MGQHSAGVTAQGSDDAVDMPTLTEDGFVSPSLQMQAPIAWQSTGAPLEDREVRGELGLWATT